MLILRVLECPSNSKLVEILEQIAGHVYQLSGLFVDKHCEKLIDVVYNDISICSKLNKKFNPALTMIIVKLLSLPGRTEDFYENVREVTSKHLELLGGLPSSQVLTCEILKSLN